MGASDKRPDACVVCCLRCFSVLEGHFTHREAGLKLYELLGLGKVSGGADDQSAASDDCR
jgi:hypothetical protein